MAVARRRRHRVTVRRRRDIASRRQRRATHRSSPTAAAIRRRRAVVVVDASTHRRRHDSLGRFHRRSSAQNRPSTRGRFIEQCSRRGGVVVVERCVVDVVDVAEFQRADRAPESSIVSRERVDERGRKSSSTSVVPHARARASSDTYASRDSPLSMVRRAYACSVTTRGSSSRSIVVESAS